MLAVILAIQLQQLNAYKNTWVVMGIGMQLVEVGLAVLSSPNRLPVHDDRADPKRPQGVDYPRMLVRPVVASTGVEPDPVAVPSMSR